MKIGDTTTVKVDPATNGGFDEAAAIVTGVHDDGSLRMRVFGETSVQDTTRNYVGDDGEPFQQLDTTPTQPDSATTGTAPAAGAADPAGNDQRLTRLEDSVQQLLDALRPAPATDPAAPAAPTS